MASTLTTTGTTLSYAGSPGAVSDISISQAGSTTPDTVTITRNSGDNDAVTGTAPSNCSTADGGTTYVCTNVSAVTASGGDGNDTLDASGLTTIPATLSGGDGDDNVIGGNGADTVNGDAGNDTLEGNGGNDAVSGGDGDDQLAGGTGTDTVSGGNGDDAISVDYEVHTNLPGGEAVREQDTGDSISGGDGLDTVYFYAVTVDEHGTSSTSDDTSTPLATSISLDDTANDGATGENANVRSDVESVTAISDGTNTITGSAGINQLRGGNGNDTIDGGAGNDVLNGNGGNDTINARDGYADFVTCGPGNDVANVDSLDTVSSDCETVNRVDVGNANEDHPPTIALTAPADNARLTNKRPTTITANVADDKGITAVIYTVNGRIVCAPTAAPYSCSYQPQGTDVGRTAIVATAVDSTQQTATAQRTVSIGRFDPHRFTAAVSPKRDHIGSATFRTKGTLTLPITVAKAQGCGFGTVTVQVKAGSTTLSTRRVKLSKSCTYSSRVTFHSRSRFGRHTRLTFNVHYGGSAVLRHSATKHVSVRIT